MKQGNISAPTSFSIIFFFCCDVQVFGLRRFIASTKVFHKIFRYLLQAGDANNGAHPEGDMQIIIHLLLTHVKFWTYYQFEENQGNIHPPAGQQYREPKYLWIAEG